MLPGLIAKKIDQKQTFLEDGRRIPVTVMSVAGNVVCQTKTADHDGYSAIQLGFGNKNKSTKAIAGHIQKAGIKTTPRFFREIRVDDVSGIEPGSAILASSIFAAGDIVNVVGTSKGKGFAGGVKRHGFRGGPRTHGQSDRERAPGSIGQTTTPGRVYKGKRMAGNMGNDTVTVKNLEVADVTDETILIKGLVPGAKGSILQILKVGENKKFTPLFKNAVVPVVEVVEEEIQAEVPEVKAEAETVEEEVQTPSVEVTAQNVEAKTEVQTEEKPEEVQPEAIVEEKEEVQKEEKEEENAGK